MSQVASIEELYRLALSTGAAVEIDGADVFNAGMRQAGSEGVSAAPASPPEEIAVIAIVDPAPTPAPQPASVVSVPAPAPASESSMSRDELAEVLAARDAFWMAEIQRMTKTMIEGFLAASAKPAPHGWRFEPHYHRGGLLSHIDAIPRAGE